MGATLPGFHSMRTILAMVWAARQSVLWLLIFPRASLTTLSPLHAVVVPTFLLVRLLTQPLPWLGCRRLRTAPTPPAPTSTHLAAPQQAQQALLTQTRLSLQPLGVRQRTHRVKITRRSPLLAALDRTCTSATLWRRLLPTRKRSTPSATPMATRALL